MQTVVRDNVENQSSRARKRQHRQSPDTAGNLVLFLCLLAVWVAFVVTLEDFDFDTGFLALFCACLSMFVIKALLAAFKR